MRLIDADALPKYTGYALSAVEVAKAVENAPTIAASPWHRVEDEVMRFLKSQWYGTLCDIRPERIIKKLKEEEHECH